MLVLLVHWVPLAPQANLDHLDLQDFKVSQVLLDLVALLDHLEIGDQLEV